MRSVNTITAYTIDQLKPGVSQLFVSSFIVNNKILITIIGHEEIDFEYRPMSRPIMADACMAPMDTGVDSYDMDIEPDDIEVSDTVTVIWEIG